MRHLITIYLHLFNHTLSHQEEVQGPTGDGQQKGDWMCIQQEMEGQSSQPHSDPAPAQLVGTGTQEKAPETCDDLQDRSRRGRHP